MTLIVQNFGDNTQQPSAIDAVYNPDQLIAGDLKVVSDTITLHGTAALPRGTVLGAITASGLYITSVATATDGSQVPAAILADNADPSTGDVQAGVYIQGEFNANYINYDSSWTLVTLKPALRKSGPIYLKGVVNAQTPT
ncbi:MAG: head decoration protein [Methylococcales bacterium]